MIYFIKAGNLNQIKIGYSKDPERRIKAIQTSSPLNIEIIKIIKGTKQHEKEIHEKFNHININGEWYQETEELLNFIEKIYDYDVLESNNKKTLPFYNIKKTEVSEIINNKKELPLITTERIRAVGDSQYINIRKDFMELLELEIGDFVKIIIEKIEKDEKD